MSVVTKATAAVAENSDEAKLAAHRARLAEIATEVNEEQSVRQHASNNKDQLQAARHARRIKELEDEAGKIAAEAIELDDKLTASSRAARLAARAKERAVLAKEIATTDALLAEYAKFLERFIPAFENMAQIENRVRVWNKRLEPGEEPLKSTEAKRQADVGAYGSLPAVHESINLPPARVGGPSRRA
jgi:hypothetical protein